MIQLLPIFFIFLLTTFAAHVPKKSIGVPKKSSGPLKLPLTHRFRPHHGKRQLEIPLPQFSGEIYLIEGIFYY